MTARFFRFIVAIHKGIPMMKFTLFTTLFVSMSALAHPLHLDLETSSSEYRKILGQEKNNSQKSFNNNDDPAITEALALGERLSKWINVVNARRSQSTAIRLTSAATSRGIPISRPNMYSPQIIKKTTEEIIIELPKVVKSILLTNAELTSALPISDETFIEYARKIDKNYQRAARYKSINVHRDYYIKAATKDVRGFYYLKTNNITENELRDPKNFSGSKLATVIESLIQLCANGNGDTKKCGKDVHKALSNNELDKIYKSYIKAGEKNWNSFFQIPSYGVRYDVSWNGNTTVVPFNTPEIPKFVPYLKNNIEDEFRFGTWGLKLNFGVHEDGPYLKFQAGVVPHVDRLGGNQIVMDSNQSIEEYESQWTIRHEFGHILGLPDCYHEFFDVKKNAYVNYQLDITDLMCSRAGKMNERIFLELKKAYTK